MIKTESSITQQYLDIDSVVLFWGVIIDVFPQYQDDCVGISETKKKNSNDDRREPCAHFKFTKSHTISVL